MTDAETGLQIWCDSHQFSVTEGKLISYQEEIARRAAVIIAGEHGFIARTLSKKSECNAPKCNKAYEALLRYYHYDLTYTGGDFLKAFAALELAVEKEPESKVSPTPPQKNSDWLKSA